MFREDSQIIFAEENVLLNFSLRPLLPPAYMIHSNINNQLKMCWLDVITDDKLSPVGICYVNGVDWRLGMSLLIDIKFVQV